MDVRLDKFLKDQGIAARSELKALIRKGCVRVNNQPEKDPGAHIDPERDQIAINGEPVLYRKFVYYMINKPKGLITATEDKTLATVLDLFPENIRRRNVFPVGRLDRDTEGLLIITDDGVFAHNVISPKKHVMKLYEAKLDSFPGHEAIRDFENGIVLDDGYKAMPAKLRMISECPVTAQVEIYEGKFHQVKRMFKAAGSTVQELKRLRIGEVWLDEALKPGEFRELTPEEVVILGGAQNITHGAEL
jgi:16S rRNA pseudouridine516 synthase